jgi:leucyl aminopeptidase
MKITVRDVKEMQHVCDALILPLLEDEGTGPYKDIDRALDGLLSRVLASKEFRGEHGEVHLIHTYGKIKPSRVLCVGLGKRDSAGGEKLRQAGGKAASYLHKLGLKSIALSTASIDKLKLKPADFLEGCLLSQYRFTAYKGEWNRQGVRNITVLAKKDIKGQIKWIEASASAVHFARDLINTPASDMTPTALARAARSIKGASVKVIGKKEAERLGMGAYLSVAKGSTEPPKFIVAAYKGKSDPPVVLVGKSITFDSGGLNLKTAEAMDHMKYDMAGGAAVLGVIRAASAMKLPAHLIGILPAAENLPGGSASKPGDVVSTVAGKTVEITNTDAEGRLALADAIGYARRFKPRAIIDLATLTGACPIALGNEAVAMMGNDESLMESIKMASEETHERVWQMPLYDEYKEYIKSDIADLVNYSGRSGSLVTSAYFLKEFAGNVPWVHLDIASMAWAKEEKPYVPKGATGVGVRLMLNFIESCR